MKTRLLISLMVLCRFAACGEDVASLYQIHCSSCHGDHFQGGNAQSLVNGVWQFGREPGHIARNIRNGITHLGMPGYGEILSNRQIDALARYLLEAERQAGATKPPIPETLQTLDYNLSIEKWAEGLDLPWSLAFLDEGMALVTERRGRLRLLRNGRLDPRPVEGTPEVVAEGQGGLLAVAFDPDYGQDGNGWVYLAFSHGIEPDRGTRAPAMTKVVRGRIDGHRWTGEQTLFEAPHATYRTSRIHFGTRLVFDADKNLYFAIGDRGAQDQAQDLSRPNGKIHRIRRDGAIPPDNPFRNHPGALPSIFSLGHRNPQGMAFHPRTGQLWISEHGPLGGDEINLVVAGKNYGWPVITYGKNYNGTPITDHVRQEGMEQPIWYWRPSTAVCGIDFCRGDLFPRWSNKLVVGALKYEDVRVLDIEGDRVMHEELILKNAGRVRDVVCGPGGALYIVLNDPGTILRLAPRR